MKKLDHTVDTRRDAQSDARIDAAAEAKLDAAFNALAARVPAPRRTDAAFARSVADGVRTKKHRSVFVFPLAAATTAALAVFALIHPAASTTAAHDAGTPQIAMADAVPSFEDDDTSPFALPSLEGSSDEDLARLDHALDVRLQHAH